MYSTFYDRLPSTKYTNKCIVLDIDETLVHTFEEFSDLPPLKLFTDARNTDIRIRTYMLHLDDIVEKKGQMFLFEMFGVTRPYVEDFLSFCFQYFQTVVVWSAGQKSYVHSICDFLFRNVRPPDLIWTREDCVSTFNEDGELMTCEKPLAKLYQLYPQYINEKNTLILDDKLEVFLPVNPYNGIHIPKYEPTPTLRSMRKEDMALVHAQRWFMRPEVAFSTDVRTLPKGDIFL